MFGICAAENQGWLTNASFQGGPSESIDPDVETIDSDEEELEAEPKGSRKQAKKKKKKQRKQHKGKRMKVDSAPDDQLQPQAEFTGKENYYVDKNPCKSYITLKTLNKKTAARYHVCLQQIGTPWRSDHHRPKSKVQRYFSKPKGTKAKALVDEEATKVHRVTETEFMAKTKVLNKNLLANAKDIDTWLELIEYQQHFYMKMTKVQVAERKMDILHQALRDNPSDDRLYREYIAVLENAYPSFEVSKFLDVLIEKGKVIRHW